jgi:hypothetical protein
MISQIKEQFVINSFIQISISLNFFQIVKFLPEEFFQVLLGIRNSCLINLDINLIKKIQLLIFYLRLISGIEIYLVNKYNKFFLVNINDNFSKIAEKNKFISYKKFVNDFIDKVINNDKFDIKSNFKNIFLSNLYKRNIIKIKSPIKDIVIITHNRPEILKRTVQEYINNFNIFGYTDIKITISDDSDEVYYIKNKEVLKDINYDIEHIYLNEKYKKINFIKKKYLNYSESIDYIFGINNFKTNIARNRNFVSFLLKNRNFVSIDDDSRPIVLTYSFETIFKAIKRMFENNDFELINITKYVNNKNKIFLPVNFIGNFSNYDLEFLKYSKYSGIEDDSLFYQLLKLFSYYLKIDDNLFLINSFTEKFFSKKSQGLCLFFPDKLNNYKFTLPENFRLEDTIIGINYYNETLKYPISSNFAIYHDKKIDFININKSDLKNEVISTFIFLIYENFFSLNVDKYLYIKIPDSIFQKIDYEINLTYKAFIKYYKISLLNRNLQIANYINRILILLKENFINYDYRKEIEEYVNKILLDYFNAYKVWIKINEYS